MRFRRLSGWFRRCFDQQTCPEVLAAQTRERATSRSLSTCLLVCCSEFFTFLRRLACCVVLCCVLAGSHARLCELIWHRRTSERPPPSSPLQPPTSFIHVSIRACHSPSVGPPSAHHRSSLNRSVRGPLTPGPSHVRPAVPPPPTICPIRPDR